ncbi:hypothetical protein [Vibrio phage vB_VpaP_SJSY21]|nr:hypothetical protein [Vibrio phage vB_VpaP_SJSY21]
MLIEIPNELGFSVLKEFEDGYTIEQCVVYMLKEALGITPSMEDLYEKEHK